ncbi:MAG: maltotransferase domain-containing protein, partial [Limisphaerales bacterium]
MKELQTFSFPVSGQNRVTIENVTPQIDAGRFAIKRVIGESVVVEADIFADGHDALSAVLKFRAEKNPQWTETPMRFLSNDRWHGEFAVTEVGNYFYTIEAWVDHFKSWQNDLRKKLDAGQTVPIEMQIGARFVEAAARRATASDSEKLLKLAGEFKAGETANGSCISTYALENGVADLMSRYPDRSRATTFEKELRVIVDPERARFSAWYELFPRSYAPEIGKHGTFKDCEAQLPRIAKMGFDVLYFPPIHPIGKSFRKGKNNNPICEPGEPGSPWAIGAIEGGHKSIHPELGTLEDFQQLVRRARELKIEIAMDITFQCSPDHPYVKEHPDWFLKRPDGSIQ